jgi:hypothetical protein
MNSFRSVLSRGILVGHATIAVRTTNTGKSNNHRMIQQLVFHKQQTIKASRVQDLDPRTCADNAHESVLAHEMAAIEPREIPFRTLTWKPLAFLSHIKRRSNDDRFSASQWESFICSSLGVPTPALLGQAQQCACNAFAYDTFGDHLQTCQTKSASSQVHDWVVYKLGALLGSVGHRVKIHNITSATGKERGDLQIKDYVVLQKPQTQANRLPPPHTLILDYTMTYIRFGRSHLHPMETSRLLTSSLSLGVPVPHGTQCM